jgi:hypothetical protein
VVAKPPCRLSPPFTGSATALRPSDPASPRHSSDCSSAAFAERISSGNCASTSSLGGSPCGPYFSHAPFVLDARSSSGLSPLASSGSTQLGRGGYRIRRRSRRRPLSTSLDGLRGGADGLGARLTPRSLGSNAWPGAWLLFGLSASGLAVADASTAEDSGDVDDEWCSVSSCGGATTTTCHAKDVLTNYRRIGEPAPFAQKVFLMSTNQFKSTLCSAAPEGLRLDIGCKQGYGKWVVFCLHPLLRPTGELGHGFINQCHGCINRWSLWDESAVAEVCLSCCRCARRWAVSVPRGGLRAQHAGAEGRAGQPPGRAPGRPPPESGQASPPTSPCHFWQLLRFTWKLVLHLDALCAP